MPADVPFPRTALFEANGAGTSLINFSDDIFARIDMMNNPRILTYLRARATFAGAGEADGRMSV
ncbi:MAG: hypothetical protein ACJA1F_000049 [Paracoccaceae bacterium]|jgi:hypothetical protein